MKLYRFTVILAGAPEMTEQMANALFESGCDDGTPGSCDGVSHVHFDRESSSLDEAIRSAVTNVRKAGLEIERIEMECDDLQESVEAAPSANL